MSCRTKVIQIELTLNLYTILVLKKAKIKYCKNDTNLKLFEAARRRVIKYIINYSDKK